MKTNRIVLTALVLALFSCKKQENVKPASTQTAHAQADDPDFFVNHGLEMLKKYRINLADFVEIIPAAPEDNRQKRDLDYEALANDEINDDIEGFGDFSSTTSSDPYTIRNTTADERAPLSGLRIYIGEFKAQGYVKTDKWVELNLQNNKRLQEPVYKGLVKGFGSTIAFYIMTMQTFSGSPQFARVFNGKKTIDHIAISSAIRPTKKPVPPLYETDPSNHQRGRALALDIAAINNKKILAMVNDNDETEMRSLLDLQKCFERMNMMVEMFSLYTSMADADIEDFPNVGINESIGPRYFSKFGKPVTAYSATSTNKALRNLYAQHQHHIHISTYVR